MSLYADRIRLAHLREKITTAEEAAKLVKNGQTVGMSGFTRAGEAKLVPLALAERARHEELKITLITGASLGNEMDGLMAERCGGRLVRLAQHHVRLCRCRFLPQEGGR